MSMGVIFIIFRAFSYSKESEKAAMRNREIIIENHIPVLTDEEAFEQWQSIEEGLFDIFEKYQNNQENRIDN